MSGVLLAAAAVPAVISLSGALVEEHPGRWSGLLTALQVGAACVAFAAVLAFERPRSASPLAYARQLRARLLELQSTYDADFRRRPEGKEKEDDLEVSSEP